MCMPWRWSSSLWLILNHTPYLQEFVVWGVKNTNMKISIIYFIIFFINILFATYSFGQIGEIKIVNVKPGTRVSIVSPYNSYNVPFPFTIESGENGVVTLPVALNSNRIVAVTYGFQKGFICLLGPKSKCVYTLGNANEICSITGDNYLINNFLEKKSSLSNSFKHNDKSITEWNLNNDEAIIGFNLLKESIWQLFNELKSQIGEYNILTKNIEEYLHADLSLIKLNVISSKFMVYDIEEFKTINKGYIDIFNSVELIDSLVHFAPNTYIMLLNYYSNILFNEHILKRYSGHKGYMNMYPESYMNRIYYDKFYFLTQQSLPNKTKEIMLADLLLNEVNEAEVYDSLYYKGMEYIENEEIQTLLKEKGIRLNMSDKGISERLLNLKGKTIDGNWKKFSELRGKAAYIDFWATWCGPCLAEFKHSKKMQELYKNSNIEFVYVSIDEEYDKWKNFITNTNVPVGLHLFFSEGEVVILNKAIYMNGIPRYILISEQGDIINVNAPRPSDPKLKEVLDELLKN